MDTLNSLNDLLYEQAMALYDAEKQVEKDLPAIIDRISSPALTHLLERQLVQGHHETHRVEAIFRKIRQKYPERKNEVVHKMLFLASETLEKAEEGEVIDTIVFIMAKQLNAYMIAGYKEAVRIAHMLGLKNIEEHFRLCLEEELEAEKSLSEYEEQALNAA